VKRVITWELASHRGAEGFTFQKIWRRSNHFGLTGGGKGDLEGGEGKQAACVLARDSIGRSHL